MNWRSSRSGEHGGGAQIFGWKRENLRRRGSLLRTVADPSHEALLRRQASPRGRRRAVELSCRARDRPSFFNEEKNCDFSACDHRIHVWLEFTFDLNTLQLLPIISTRLLRNRSPSPTKHCSPPIKLHRQREEGSKNVDRSQIEPSIANSSEPALQQRQRGGTSISTARSKCAASPRTWPQSSENFKIKAQSTRRIPNCKIVRRQYQIMACQDFAKI